MLTVNFLSITAIISISTTQSCWISIKMQLVYLRRRGRHYTFARLFSWSAGSQHVPNFVCSSRFISERELKFMFAICHRPSVCLSVVCRLFVTFVRPTQTIEIFGNVSMPSGTLTIHDLSIKILRRSSQGNPSVGELNTRGVAKYSDFGSIERYISETVQDRS